MKKFIVETYYTCTFKTVHSLDDLNDKELEKIDRMFRKQGRSNVEFLGWNKFFFFQIIIIT